MKYLRAFQTCDFGETAPVTLGAAESCLQKYSDQLRIPDHLAAQANYVHVVVLDTLPRRKTFVDQAGPHARHLVGGNARTHATTADCNPAFHLAACNGTGQSPGPPLQLIRHFGDSGARKSKKVHTRLKIRRMAPHVPGDVPHLLAARSFHGRHDPRGSRKRDSDDGEPGELIVVRPAFREGVGRFRTFRCTYCVADPATVRLHPRPPPPK